jgi:hypothetical protein
MDPEYTVIGRVARRIWARAMRERYGANKPSLEHLQAASIQYRIAVGPNAGRKALTLYTVPPVEDALASGLVASIAGFSLHAGTVCEPWQRSRLERLCRYITRPPTR